MIGFIWAYSRKSQPISVRDGLPGRSHRAVAVQHPPAGRVHGPEMTLLLSQVDEDDDIPRQVIMGMHLLVRESSRRDAYAGRLRRTHG
jgi:hypothetical protein